MAKKKMVSFRTEEWLADGLDEIAGQLGLSRTEYLEKVLAEGLRRWGYTQAAHYARKSAARQAIQESLDTRE